MKSVGFILTKLDHAGDTLFYSEVTTLREIRWSRCACDAYLAPAGGQHELANVVSNHAIGEVGFVAVSIDQLPSGSLDSTGIDNEDIHLVICRRNKFLVGFSHANIPIWKAKDVYSAARYPMSVVQEVKLLAAVLDATVIPYHIKEFQTSSKR